MVHESRYKYSSRLRSVWSNKYFDWLTTQMNQENEVHVGVHSEKRFKEALQKIGVAPPSSRTMKDVMKELVGERLLIRIGWGLYKVNPIIEWKGYASKRLEEIRTLSGSGMALQPNVDTTPHLEEQQASPVLASSRDEATQENISSGETEATTSETPENK